MNKCIFFTVVCIFFSITITAQDKKVQRIAINSVTPSITSIVPVSCSEFDAVFLGKIKKKIIDNKDTIASINRAINIIYAKKNNEIDVRGKMYFFAESHQTTPFLEFCFDKFFNITHCCIVLLLLFCFKIKFKTGYKFMINFWQ